MARQHIAVLLRITLANERVPAYSRCARLFESLRWFMIFEPALPCTGDARGHFAAVAGRCRSGSGGSPGVRAGRRVPLLQLSPAAVGTRTGLAAKPGDRYRRLLHPLELAPGGCRNDRLHREHQPPARSHWIDAVTQARGIAGLDPAGAPGESMDEFRLPGWDGIR